jgi:hypothetical protein
VSVVAQVPVDDGALPCLVLASWDWSMSPLAPDTALAIAAMVDGSSSGGEFSHRSSGLCWTVGVGGLRRGMSRGLASAKLGSVVSGGLNFFLRRALANQFRICCRVNPVCLSIASTSLTLG